MRLVDVSPPSSHQFEKIKGKLFCGSPSTLDGITLVPPTSPSTCALWLYKWSHRHIASASQYHNQKNFCRGNNDTKKKPHFPFFLFSLFSGFPSILLSRPQHPTRSSHQFACFYIVCVCVFVCVQLVFIGGGGRKSNCELITGQFEIWVRNARYISSIIIRYI